MAEINLTKEQKDKVRAAFIAFLEWKDEHDVKCDGAEETVTDGQYSAGTLDFVGEIDGVRTVVDFKSSKKIWPEMRIQVAAYLEMYNKQYPELKAKHCGILRLDKDTGYPEYRRVKDVNRQLFIYHHMVQQYYGRHPKIAKGALVDIKI